jgi:DNA invertase Pin-like site-specific DNA recombinase
MISHELIKPSHVARKAVIYIRQSTNQQVMSNLESQQLQRAMRERARQLGWPEQLIETVEVDTGLSGQSTVGREGYKRLLAEIGQGRVGMVLSYESARLTRNCSDWYRLLDWCALDNCLIGDRDGVYEPANSNGRLLLGMKGMLSEFELHTLRGRLIAGSLNKARRGELAQNLPVGLERLGDGRVVKDPDLAVQGAIEVVFARFEKERSACRVARGLRESGLKLPRRRRNQEIIWRQPTADQVNAILKNPAYAGAFVYGRSHNERRVQAEGTRVARRRVAMEEWPVIVKGRYEPYISWVIFERNQATLKDNRAEYDRKRTRGTPRQGDALLQGIAYCGECARKMGVQYNRHGRYICRHDHTQSGAPVCQSLLSSPIDQAVVRAFFEALSPAEIDVYQRTIERQEKAGSEIRAAQDREIERLRYQTDLARRQYDRVDPDNRLVAGELERRWEESLRALKEAENRFEDARAKNLEIVEKRLPPELRAAMLNVGQSLPRLWESDLLQTHRRKALLRCLIDKVVMKRTSGADHIDVRIVWRGGADTEIGVPIAVGSKEAVARFEEMQVRMLELEEKGLSDDSIARVLTEEGYRSPREPVVLPATVRVQRLALRRVHRYRKPREKKIDGHLTVPQLAKALGVRNEWLYYRIKTGKIVATLDPTTGLYLFPDQPQTIESLRRLKQGTEARQ